MLSATSTQFSVFVNTIAFLFRKQVTNFLLKKCVEMPFRITHHCFWWKHLCCFCQSIELLLLLSGKRFFTAFIQLLANNSETVVRHLLLNCSVTSVVVFSQLPLPALCQMDSSSSILLQKTLHCNVLFCQTLIIATIANDCNQKALLFRYYELFFQCCTRILQIYVHVFNTYYNLCIHITKT